MHLGNPFKKIGIIGRPRKQGENRDTVGSLIHFLQEKNCDVFVEANTATQLNNPAIHSVRTDQLYQACDLLVVIGGDGSLLRTARIAVDQNLPVLGINRGKLGFLTDIPPAELDKVGQVIEGHYLEEQRLLLTTKLDNGNQYSALNDVVLHSGNISHMIEFDVIVNGEFMCSQRADGFIVATPTGSTAYALSTDGPLLHPLLKAILLVSICPHTLSSRPMVVSSDHQIEIIVSKDNLNSALLSCDGEEPQCIAPGGRITISKKPTMLRLIHPMDYSYFATLRQKLRWEGKRC